MTKKNIFLSIGIVLIGLAIYFGIDKYNHYQFSNAHIKEYKLVIFAAIAGIYCITQAFSKPKNKKISHSKETAEKKED